jgi:hypothetical protein
MAVQINNEIIDKNIKFEINRFKDECLKIYSTIIDDNIKKAHNEIYDAMVSEIKNNIMKTIGGNNLYDYSTLPNCAMDDIALKCLQHNQCNCKQCFGNNKLKIYLDEHKHYNIQCTKDNCLRNLKIYNKCRCVHIDNFMNMTNGEKSILCYEFKSNSCADDTMLRFQLKDQDGKYDCAIDHHGNNFFQCTTYIVVTNFGKVLQIFDTEGNNNCTYQIKCTEIKFWIPIDYIKIIELTKPHNIIEILQMIKDTLYDRKNIPLYVKDIVDENTQLKSTYDEYGIRLKEFNDIKYNFETTMKPYLDLIETKKELEIERNEIRKEKERLRLVSLKFLMDKKKLEENMKMVNDQMRQLNILDVDDILK